MAHPNSEQPPLPQPGMEIFQKIYPCDQLAISELPFASVPKWCLHAKPFVWNVFQLHIHFHANQTNFHLNGFAQTRFETKAKGNSEMAY